MPLLANQNKPSGEGRVWLLLLIIFVISMIICLSGCISQKQIDKICQTCPRHDSTVIKEVTKIERYDSTIFITQIGEPIYLENPCSELCDSFGKLKPVYIKKKNKGITTTIKNNAGKLEVDCDVDSLKEVIKGLNIERTLIKESFLERFKIINECTETWFQKTYKYFFWVVLSALVLILGVRVLRK